MTKFICGAIIGFIFTLTALLIPIVLINDVDESPTKDEWRLM